MDRNFFRRIETGFPDPRPPRHNRGRAAGLADGIVITPSHNPPDDGGFKYNPPTAGRRIPTSRAGSRARPMPCSSEASGREKHVLASRLCARTTHRHDYLNAYVERSRQRDRHGCDSRRRNRMGVDPLGGAGVHYWGRSPSATA
jgi:phosphoglucomutase